MLSCIHPGLVAIRRNVRGDVPMNRRGVCRRLLVIPYSTGSVRAAADGWRVHRHILEVLRAAKHMHVVPDLAQNRPASVAGVAVPASLRLVVPRTTAANVWNGSVHGGERVLNVYEVVSRAIVWCNAVLLQELEGWELLVVSDCCLKEIDDLLVLLILWAIAGNVEGGVAGGVFAELMAPEVGIGASSTLNVSGSVPKHRNSLSTYCEIQYLFIQASKSYLPKASTNVPMLGPSYGGTTVPFGNPLVVFGEGTGSNCRVKSQY